MNLAQLDLIFHQSYVCNVIAQFCKSSNEFQEKKMVDRKKQFIGITYKVLGIIDNIH
jgi:hypothetical protein